MESVANQSTARASSKVSKKIMPSMSVTGSSQNAPTEWKECFCASVALTFSSCSNNAETLVPFDALIWDLRFSSLTLLLF